MNHTSLFRNMSWHLCFVHTLEIKNGWLANCAGGRNFLRVTVCLKWNAYNLLTMGDDSAFVFCKLTFLNCCQIQNSKVILRRLGFHNPFI